MGTNCPSHQVAAGLRASSPAETRQGNPASSPQILNSSEAIPQPLPRHHPGVIVLIIIPTAVNKYQINFKEDGFV